MEWGTVGGNWTGPAQKNQRAVFFAASNSSRTSNSALGRAVIGLWAITRKASELFFFE